MNRAFALAVRRGILVVCLLFTAISVVDADSILGNGIPDVLYDQVTGQLTVTPDGADITTVLVEGPRAISIDRWLDGTTQDGAGWSQAYSSNREQWIITGAFGPGGTGAEFVPQGTYQIATYDVNSVSVIDFGAVELATQNPLDTLTTTVELAGPEFIDGDYNASGLVEQADMDLVLLNWGVSTPPIPDGWVHDLPEGNVDQAELDGVLLAWGAGSAASVALVRAVPEPVSSSLLWVPMLLAVKGLRRRQKRGKKS